MAPSVRLLGEHSTSVGLMQTERPRSQVTALIALRTVVADRTTPQNICGYWQDATTDVGVPSFARPTSVMEEEGYDVQMLPVPEGVVPVAAPAV